MNLGPSFPGIFSKHWCPRPLHLLLTLMWAVATERQLQEGP